MSSAVLRRNFSVIVVVQDARFQRQGNSKKLVKGINPIYSHMQERISECRIRNKISESESRYKWVKVVSASNFKENYLPYLEDV